MDADCWMVGSAGGNMTGHVLDNAGLLAGQLTDAVLIQAGTGVQFSSFIYRRFHVSLGGFASQIGTGNVDLQGGDFWVGCYNIKIFKIHECSIWVL